MRLKTYGRVLHLVGLLQYHDLDRWFLSWPLRSLIRPFYWGNPRLWGKKPKGLSQGTHIRKSLESLGPIFVKFGQGLSTRQDLFSESIIEELSLLQDRVPAFCGAEARARIEEAWGHPLDEVLAHFDEQPLASASVAQVHEATLKTGESVVLKVIRPNVKADIEQDLALLHFCAHAFLRVFPGANRFNPHGVIDVFERHLRKELDLVQEGANASHLARNFKHSGLLHVPYVHWKHTRETVLVMEKVGGVKISHIHTMRGLGVDFKVLAENGVTIFFTQLLRDNFFHADMHPGNIFVDCQEPSRPKYVAVDFGIMGSLSKEDQRYIAENFLAFFEQDYQRVALMHIRSGWVPKSTCAEDFADSIRAVCEPIFEKPFSEISYASLLGRLLGIAELYKMPVQPQLILLQKTLVNIEGLGRQLYPELDLWTTAKPLLKEWMKEQRSPKRFFKQMSKQLPYWKDYVLDMPDLLYQSLQHEPVQAVVAPSPSLFSVRFRAFFVGFILGGGALFLGLLDSVVGKVHHLMDVFGF
jgi:ubiquinone biosynthesis protein